MCVTRDGGWQCSESEQPLEETAVIEAVSVLEGLWQGWTLTPSSNSNNNILLFITTVLIPAHTYNYTSC